MKITFSFKINSNLKMQFSSCPSFVVFVSTDFQPIFSVFKIIKFDLKFSSDPLKLNKKVVANQAIQSTDILKIDSVFKCMGRSMPMGTKGNL